MTLLRSFLGRPASTTSFKGVLILLISLATLAGNLTPVAGDPLELTRFSVLQFRLYMSPEEALTIARRERFNTAIEHVACARDAMIEIRKKRRTHLLFLSMRRCVTSMKFSDKKRGLRSELNFIEDFPNRPNTMRLYSIHTFEKNQTLSDRRNLEEQLTAEYGAPTVREQDVAAWCSRDEERECLYSMEFIPRLSDIGVADFSFLKSINGQLSGLSVQGLPYVGSFDNDVEFELFDIPYASARSDAISAAYKRLLGER